jgi:polysaccharide deacetylase family protein (PEP-CTERM system associated)
VNVITVDVEDYFHASAFDRVVRRDQWGSLESRVSASTDRLLAMFADAGVTATFFVLGWVGERFPELLTRILDNGHEVACHSYAHRLIYELSPREFRADVRRAKLVLEAATGKPVVGFRAPSYSITERSLWAFDILIEEGFTYDSSLFPVHHDRYGMPSAPRHVHVVDRNGSLIWELPPSTVRWAGINLPMAGGGYLRLLPFAWTKRGIRRINRVEAKPAIFYVHPWELDPVQPRLPVSPMTRIRHYHNLGRTEHRLDQLLRQFRFASVRDVMPEVHRPPRLGATTGAGLDGARSDHPLAIEGAVGGA